MINPALAQTAVGVVPRRAQRHGAPGINNTFRQVGIATGTAMLGAVFQARVETRLTDLGAVPKARVAQAAEAISAGQTRGIPAARDAFVGALDEILIVAAVIAFVCAVAGAGADPRPRLRGARRQQRAVAERRVQRQPERYGHGHHGQGRAHARHVTQAPGHQRHRQR